MDTTSHPIACQSVILSGVKLADLVYREPEYPYSVLLAQLQPEFGSGWPLKHKLNSEYRNKIHSVIQLAIEQKVNFCIMPEYALPLDMIPEVRGRLMADPPHGASPGSIYLLPLEHLPRGHLGKVLDQAGVVDPWRSRYLQEFQEVPPDKTINLCWIAAKGQDGLISHFQAKIRPAAAEEKPVQRFQGGRKLRIFITEDDPPLAFAMLLCIDFIAGKPGQPLLWQTIVDIIQTGDCREHPVPPLNWLFVPQCNPDPIHPDFEATLDAFYLAFNKRGPSAPAPAVFWINAAGGFDHPLAREGEFGGSALVHSAFPRDTALYFVRPCPLKDGRFRKLTFTPEGEFVCIYAANLLARQGIAGGRGFDRRFFFFKNSRIREIGPGAPLGAAKLRHSTLKLQQALRQEHARELKKKVFDSQESFGEFIPLRLEKGELPKAKELEEQRSQEKLKWDPRSLDRTWLPFAVDQLWKQRGRYVIAGEVGAGKTTFLHWLASEPALTGDRFPFFLDLRQKEEQITDYDKLERHFLHRYGQFLPSVRRAEFFRDMCRRGKVSFLLDGLDQISPGEYHDLVDAFLKALGNYPVTVVITTRPTPLSHLKSVSDLTFLRLRDFDRRDQELYFGSDYPAARKICGQSPDLTQIPMLAYMVRLLLRKKIIQPGITRTALYEKFIHHVLYEHLAAPPGSPQETHYLLKSMSFQSLAASQMGLCQYEIFRECARHEGVSNAKEALNDLLRFGLINHLLDRGAAEDPKLYYTHQSFQEFLAAQYAWEHPKAKKLLLEQMWQPSWREVLKFLVGMDIRGEVLAVIYPDSEADNIIYSRLFLAAACLPEDPRGETPFSRKMLDRLVSMIIEVKNGFLQRAAAEVLGKLGARLPREIIDYLTRLLGDKDWSVHSAAAYTLKKLGESLPQEIINFLARRLEDKNKSVCVAVAEGLGQMGELGEPLPREIINSLARRLEDLDGSVRQAMARALGRLKERLPRKIINSLVRHLEDEDKSVRWAATEALGKQGKSLPKKIINSLARRLDDEDDYVREAAAEALGKQGESLSREIINSLVRCLEDGDKSFRLPDEGSVRWVAAHALVNLGKRLPRETIDYLTRLLRDKDWSVHYPAVYTLKKLGESLPKEIINALARRLKDKDKSVRRAATDALGQLGELGESLPQEIINSLSRRLDDKDKYVQLSAMHALESCVKLLPQGIIDSLVRHLEDEDESVRREAMEVLRKHAKSLPQEIIDSLARRLEDTDGSVRKEAALQLEILGKLGESLPRGIINSLVRHLEDEDESVRLAATEALGKQGKSLPREVISSLARRLEDTDGVVRLGAAMALKALGGPLPREIVDYLARCLEDKDIRGIAAWTLGELKEPLPRKIIDSLARGLEDKKESVRGRTVEILANMEEPLPGEIIDSLARLIEDKDSNIRQVTAKALKNLGERDYRIWSLKTPPEKINL